jgi:hypothetical protein
MRSSSDAVNTLTRTLTQKKVATVGWSAGIKKYVDEVRTSFEDMSTAAHTIMKGVENAFARGIQGMLDGSMTGAEGMKAIWDGIIGTFTQFVSEMIAKQIALSIAGKQATASKVADSAIQTGASLVSSAAQTYEAHSSIPWVGIALAAGMIALMMSGMGEVSSKAQTTANRVPGAAEGAWFNRPTLTMIGEGSRPEVVIPDVSFERYSKNLAAGILAQNAGKRDTGGSGSVNVHLHNATILDTSNRGMEKLGNMVLSGIQVAGRRRGQVIKPGFVFGGI